MVDLVKTKIFRSNVKLMAKKDTFCGQKSIQWGLSSSSPFLGGRIREVLRKRGFLPPESIH